MRAWRGWPGEAHLAVAADDEKTRQQNAREATQRARQAGDRERRTREAGRETAVPKNHTKHCSSVGAAADWVATAMSLTFEEFVGPLDRFYRSPIPRRRTGAVDPSATYPPGPAWASSVETDGFIQKCGIARTGRAQTGRRQPAEGRVGEWQTRQRADRRLVPVNRLRADRHRWTSAGRWGRRGSRPAAAIP